MEVCFDHVNPFALAVENMQCVINAPLTGGIELEAPLGGDTVRELLTDTVAELPVVATCTPSEV